jgi:hypothetical protein
VPPTARSDAYFSAITSNEMQVVSIAIGLSILVLSVITCGVLGAQRLVARRDRKDELRVLARFGMSVPHHAVDRAQRR